MLDVPSTVVVLSVLNVASATILAIGAEFGATRVVKLIMLPLVVPELLLAATR